MWFGSYFPERHGPATPMAFTMLPFSELMTLIWFESPCSETKIAFAPAMVMEAGSMSPAVTVSAVFSERLTRTRRRPLIA